jgi:hypothetical protein
MARKPDHHPNQANLEMSGVQQYCPLSDLAALAERRRVLYAELERLISTLGIDAHTAPYWTLDNDDAPPWYSLPRAVERLREQVEGMG